MPETKKQAKPSAVASANLEALSQQQAAWLIGKPTSWLRDRVELDGRQPDGKYNGQRLVRAFVADQSSNLEPCELTDFDIHVLDQALSLFDIVLPKLAVATIERLVKEHGAAGLAAIGQFVLDEARAEVGHFRQWRECEVERPIRSAAEIRAEAEAELESRIGERIRYEATRAKQAAGMVVDQCPQCKRYEWARKWLEQLPPGGYVVDGSGMLCPDCEEIREEKRRR